MVYASAAGLVETNAASSLRMRPRDPSGALLQADPTTWADALQLMYQHVRRCGMGVRKLGCVCPPLCPSSVSSLLPLTPFLYSLRTSPYPPLILSSPLRIISFTSHTIHYMLSVPRWTSLSIYLPTHNLSVTSPYPLRTSHSTPFNRMMMRSI